MLEKQINCYAQRPDSTDYVTHINIISLPNAKGFISESKNKYSRLTTLSFFFEFSWQKEGPQIFNLPLLST
jgi:hypothetical protein